MKEWIAFIAVELVGFIPLFLYWLFKRNVDNDDEDYFQVTRLKKYAYRSLICIAICIPLFIFINKKTNIIILSVLLQLVNGLFFKRNR